MPVFFIQSNRIADHTVTIDGPLFTHLSKSLRLREGENICVGDEHRFRYRVRIDHLESKSLRASILEKIEGPPAPSAPIVLVQAILKGDRMNWVIQKATELGVAEIMPLLTSRVIVRPPAGRGRTTRERWQRIAVDAAQQSEQWAYPKVTQPITLSELFKHGSLAAVGCALLERSAEHRLGSLSIDHTFQGTIALVVGPEGGWTPEEMRELLDQRFQSITLGKSILRSETAPLVALSILQHKLGNI
jgi:16S rRNA (uracil1498-N3)-methyltransferase